MRQSLNELVIKINCGSVSIGIAIFALLKPN